MPSRIASFIGIVALSACSGPDDPVVVHQAVLEQDTQGLALHATGERGHAGMRRTNCPFETMAGAVTGDYDLPDEDETVEDSGDSPDWGGETVLLSQTGTLHLLNKRSGDYKVDTVSVPGVVTGRLSREGVVALVDRATGCAVEWTDLEVSVGVPCGAGFDVDPTTGTAYVAGSDLTMVTPQGSASVDISGDLVAWDPISHTLFVAQSGEDWLAALEANGAVRWHIDLPGPVWAVDHGGAREAAIASWERADGGGSLSWFDAWTGDELAAVETPAPAPAIASSTSGNVIALVLASQAHFYRIGHLNDTRPED